MQSKVKRFIEQHSLSCPVQSRYIDLTSEVGELGKELLKASDYGKRSPVLTAEATEEAGDCLFSLLALMNELGIDAQEALNAVLKNTNTASIKRDLPVPNLEANMNFT